MHMRIGGAYMVRACIVTAYVVMAHVVMAYAVMAYVVMARIGVAGVSLGHSLPQHGTGEARACVRARRASMKKAGTMQLWLI